MTFKSGRCNLLGMNKIIQWFKIKLRKWLFDEEYFMGADYGYHESSLVIIKRNKKTGKMTVIAENTGKNEYEHDFIIKIRQLSQQYSVPETNIVRDFPLGLPTAYIS